MTVDLTYYRAGERVLFRWNFDTNENDKGSRWYEGVLERWYWGGIGPRAIVNLDDGRKAYPTSGTHFLYFADEGKYWICPKCGYVEMSQWVCGKYRQHEDIEAVLLDFSTLERGE